MERTSLFSIGHKSFEVQESHSVIDFWYELIECKTGFVSRLYVNLSSLQWTCQIMLLQNDTEMSAADGPRRLSKYNFPSFRTFNSYGRYLKIVTNITSSEEAPPSRNFFEHRMGLRSQKSSGYSIL